MSHLDTSKVGQRAPYSSSETLMRLSKGVTGGKGAESTAAGAAAAAAARGGGGRGAITSCFKPADVHWSDDLIRRMGNKYLPFSVGHV